MPLSILTPDSIQTVADRIRRERGTDPAAARAARISCNSTIQTGKESLLVRRSCNSRRPICIRFRLPACSSIRENRCATTPRSIRRRSCARHQWNSPRTIRTHFWRCSSRSAAACGAARSTGLLWRQVDCVTGVIHVHVTEAGGLKSADSTGVVHADSTLSTDSARLQGQGDRRIRDRRRSVVPDENNAVSGRAGIVANRRLTVSRIGFATTALRARIRFTVRRKEAGSICRDRTWNPRGVAVSKTCRHRHHRAILCRP